MAEEKIIRKFSSETKALADSRSLLVTISTDSPDRDGDIIVPKGARLDNYRKNPVVLFGHKSKELPIAKASDIIADEHSVKAKVTFPTKGVHALADTIYELFKEGIMNAWSIGFQADSSKVERLDSGGLKFNEWEMYEFSAVPVPANPEALTILRGKGLSEDEIEDLTGKKAPTADAEDVDELETEATKDVAETVALAFTIDDLNWLIYMFEQNDVSDDTTTKMKEALAILMGVLRDQAKLGKKEFTIEPGAEAPALPELAEKASTEDLIKAARALRDALKPADKEIGLALRNLNSLLKNPTK